VKDIRSKVDRELLERRVARVSQALDAHAGGIELVQVDDDGRVKVRFTGMCTGCPLRPVSLAGLVRPALECVDGVSAVLAEGGRVSAEAEARLVRSLQESGTGCLLAAIVDTPADGDRNRER
jgi:Fe-S cluster biogenesis protein NfuA